MHAEGSFCTSYAPSIPWFSLRVTGGVLCHDLVERINSASQVLFFWVWNHFLEPCLGALAVSRAVCCPGQRYSVFPAVFDHSSFLADEFLCLEPFEPTGMEVLEYFPGWPWPNSVLVLETLRSLNQNAQTDVRCKVRRTFEPLKLWEENLN